MEMNFCRRCGKSLAHVHDHVYKCSNGHAIYANQSPAAGVFLVSPDHQNVLLTTRGIEPGKGSLGIPGGFLDADESAEVAVVREVHEEIGLEPEDYGTLTYITSQHDTYEYGGEGLTVITMLFWATIKSERHLKPADEVEAANWYSLATIDLGQIHAHDVRTGLLNLRKLLGAVDV
jgi:ADP-ribose pyrophosphatase YjhB (NUDIX family)